MKIKLLKNEDIIIDKNVNNLSQNSNIYVFDLLNTHTTLDIESKIFIREDEEYKFTLDISNILCNIYLKKEDLLFDIKVEYCILNEFEDNIILEYMIESDDAKFKLVINR